MKNHIIHIISAFIIVMLIYQTPAFSQNDFSDPINVMYFLLDNSEDTIIDAFKNGKIEVNMDLGNGLRPIESATLNCQFNLLKWLLDNGARIDAVSEAQQRRPLTLLALQGYLGSKKKGMTNYSLNDLANTIRLLVDAGIDINSQDNEGRTLLHDLVSYHDEDSEEHNLFQLIVFIKSLGAQSDIKDIHGKTPLDHARELNKENLFE